MQIMARIEAATIKGQPFIDRMFQIPALLATKCGKKKQNPFTRSTSVPPKRSKQTISLSLGLCPRLVQRAPVPMWKLLTSRVNQSTLRQLRSNLRRILPTKRTAKTTETVRHLEHILLLHQFAERRYEATTYESMSPLCSRRLEGRDAITTYSPHAQPKTQVTVNHQLQPISSLSGRLRQLTAWVMLWSCAMRVSS
ncbi:unnamed protein product [Acanthoscelides obtectus]|uniref:Uncharacterized protein n=1 Tax=Acanthoscelides obtectus TaxID=200917 RepID=A0A9P0QBP1_ACAOB|nr:unnamed protein product [Acanthoscelides obtectus]CAK1685605.1 hypothetical protein AOBTE_LOCUS35534 [Acanthoscelides obtectus]